MSKNEINKEIEELIKKSLKDLIEYIKCSLDIIISCKLDEELEKYHTTFKAGASREYEKLLQIAEENIREHISIEHQFKIQCEKYADKLCNLEEEKYLLLSQIVSFIS